MITPGIGANVAALVAAQAFPEAWWMPGNGALVVDERDGWLGAAASNGDWVPVHGPTTHPQVSRWLDAAFGSTIPDKVAISGVGRGDVVEILMSRNPAARIIVIEPEPGFMRGFLAARSWESEIRDRRLVLIGRGEWAVTSEIYKLAGPGLAPMLVHPTLSRRLPALAARCRAIYQSARWNSPEDSQRHEVRRSMLHPDVLLALEQAASSVHGAIVEIGAYIGGGTAAMARGLRSTGHQAPFVSIEPGGSHPDHRHLPSADIFADLTAFIHAEGLSTRVELLNGRSSDPNVKARVAELCSTGGIGLLCIDADGNVGRDFREYLPLCRPGALIVVDDYSSTEAPEKTDGTRDGVDAAVGAGLLRSMGVHGWGTWFGTLARSVTTSDLATSLAGVY